MDAREALADLTEISAQVRAAVVLDGGGGVTASTLADEERSRELARAAVRLLDAASEVRHGEQATQVHAATREGSVFVVRGDGRTITAVTAADPTAGLVFYDLKTCLRQIDEGERPAAA